MTTSKFEFFRDSFLNLATRYTELVTLKVNKEIESTKTGNQPTANAYADTVFTDMVRVASGVATTAKRLEVLKKEDDYEV